MSPALWSLDVFIGSAVAAFSAVHGISPPSTSRFSVGDEMSAVMKSPEPRGGCPDDLIVHICFRWLPGHGRTMDMMMYVYKFQFDLRHVVVRRSISVPTD